MKDTYQKFYYNKTDYLAYNKFEAVASKHDFTIVFLSGFKSDMLGNKAVFLEGLCKENDINFIRFDYRGHGQSSGDFDELGISDWKDDTLNVIDNLVDTQKVVLIGSSMGGWLMLLAGLERVAKVSGLLGIASAPDFTEDLLWDNELSDDAKNEILSNGFYDYPQNYCANPNESPEPYRITKHLIEDGRNNLVLNDDKLKNITCPVTLLHGMKDEDVPYSYSLKLQEMLGGEDIEVFMNKDSGHRFSETEDLELLREAFKKRIIGARF